jgi:hypothetical protein
VINVVAHTIATCPPSRTAPGRLSEKRGRAPLIPSESPVSGRPAVDATLAVVRCHALSGNPSRIANAMIVIRPLIIEVHECHS